MDLWDYAGTYGPVVGGIGVLVYIAQSLFWKVDMSHQRELAEAESRAHEQLKLAFNAANPPTSKAKGWLSAYNVDDTPPAIDNVTLGSIPDDVWVTLNSDEDEVSEYLYKQSDPMHVELSPIPSMIHKHGCECARCESDRALSRILPVEHSKRIPLGLGVYDATSQTVSKPQFPRPRVFTQDELDEIAAYEAGIAKIEKAIAHARKQRLAMIADVNTTDAEKLQRQISRDQNQANLFQEKIDRLRAPKDDLDDGWDVEDEPVGRTYPLDKVYTREAAGQRIMYLNWAIRVRQSSLVPGKFSASQRQGFRDEINRFEAERREIEDRMHMPRTPDGSTSLPVPFPELISESRMVRSDGEIVTRATYQADYLEKVNRPLAIENNSLVWDDSLHRSITARYRLPS